MKTKIKLKSGYAHGYLPDGVSYKNYTMLVAVANYSENGSCYCSAMEMLDEDTSTDRYQSKTRLLDGLGGFMSAVCKGDFALAWNRADGSNREALLEALKNNEIEL